jgi:hypothetical protein
MDAETRSLIREALDLYKRELDVIEANHQRQIAILEANNKRATSWQSKLPYVVGLIITGLAMGAVMPLMDHFLSR